VEVVDVSLGSEGSACGSKDDEDVNEDVEDAGEADRRVRRSVEGTLFISAIMSRLLQQVGMWTLNGISSRLKPVINGIKLDVQ
jgi:hypothetical protein